MCYVISYSPSVGLRCKYSVFAVGYEICLCIKMHFDINKVINNAVSEY